MFKKAWDVMERLNIRIGYVDERCNDQLKMFRDLRAENAALRERVETLENSLGRTWTRLRIAEGDDTELRERVEKLEADLVDITKGINLNTVIQNKQNYYTFKRLNALEAAGRKAKKKAKRK